MNVNNNVMKILIIGCSHSLGSWSENFKGIENHMKKDDEKFWRNRGEWANSSYGWYHFVDIFKNNEIDVISMPGSGYTSFYEVISMLDKKNKLNYDYLIIQETDEPRIAFLDNIKLEHIIDTEWKLKYKETDGIKTHTINSLIGKDALNIFNIKVAIPSIKGHQILQKNEWWYNLPKELYNSVIMAESSVLYKLLPSLCANLISNICLKNNIIAMTWNWPQTVMWPQYVKRSEKSYMSNTYSINLQKYNTWNKPNIRTKPHKKSDGHSTLEGNKNIGEMINNSILESGIIK